MESFKEHLNEELILEAVDVARLQKMYAEFNKKYFKNALPKIKMQFKSLKLAMGFVEAGRNRSTGEIIIKRMVINNSIKVDTLTFQKLMLHEMIHVFMFATGQWGEGHGSQFHAMRMDLSRRSGIDIPVTENVSDLGVFDQSKPKEHFALVFDGGSGQHYAMLVSVKGADDIIRSINFMNSGSFTTEQDVLDRLALSVASRANAKHVHYGIANTYLYKKLTVKRKFGGKVSLGPITQLEFNHLMGELSKNIKGITTQIK